MLPSFRDRSYSSSASSSNRRLLLAAGRRHKNRLRHLHLPFNEIPPAVGTVIKRSQNRFALTGFVKLALRRRAAAGGAIAPNAVGAAPIADVVKNMQPSNVEDAVIKYARELSGAVPPEDIDLAIPRQNALAQKTINDARRNALSWARPR